MKRWAFASTATAVVLAIAAGAVSAQWGWRSRYPPRIRPPEQRDAGFSFCRLMYASEYTGRGMGRWSTDYPRADINFMIRLSEMSTAPVHFDDDDEPIHWVVPVTNDALFGCPFIIASAVGSMVLSQDDADRLRDYLLKGGFLWVDDFWGSWEWNQWVSQITKVLPSRRVSHRRPPDRASPVPDDVLHLGGLPRSPTSASGGARAGARRNAASTAPSPTSARSSTTPAASWSR